MIEIRKAKKDELSGLIPVYREAFEKHGIFSKGPEEVLDYLENVKDNFILALDKSQNIVIGGLLIVSKKTDANHTLARIKHVAVLKNNQGQGVGRGLFIEAFREIGEAKIEIHASENEKEVIPFYKKMGLEIEGELKNHYRKGESTFCLGKYNQPEKLEVKND